MIAIGGDLEAPLSFGTNAVQLHELLHPLLAHQHSALHRDRPHPPVKLDEGVLQADPFAKYAVAFPRMSRSIFTRGNSARSRLISICSALIFTLLSAPLSWPWRCALNQL
jgi:hypothetical protein